MKRRILIIAEAVTLAHVARPLALAKIFEQLGHEVIIACSPSARRWMDDEGRSFIPIDSISQQQFLHALHMGKPVFDAPTLKRYVEADLALMDHVRPDVVIGDFRLSLWVSSKLARVPYGNVTNAYWSPRYFQYAQVPDIPLTRAVGVGLADVIFRAVYRPAFAWHARPYAQTARHFGVEPARGGLLGAYTASDCTAYADLPELYGAPQCPSANECFIGPLLWSPTVPMPEGHEHWGEANPLVYIALGSSGHSTTTQGILRALARRPFDLIVSTAGGRIELNVPDAHILDYAPGDALCRRAALVIGNGGSPITYQALAGGSPILGIAANLDQFLNMARVQASGCGRCLSGASAAGEDIAAVTDDLISDGRFRAAAVRAQTAIQGFATTTQVQTWLGLLLK